MNLDHHCGDFCQPKERDRRQTRQAIMCRLHIVHRHTFVAAQFIETALIEEAIAKLGGGGKFHHAVAAAGLVLPSDVQGS